MFAPPYLHYPETNSSHFLLRRPGIADAKSLFFFEGSDNERFDDEQVARAAIHSMIKGYQMGSEIHWLAYLRPELKLLGGFHLEGDFGSGKCTLIIDFWKVIPDETLAIELVNLVKKMCFQHLQMNLLELSLDLPEDWRGALAAMGGFEKIKEKSGRLVWAK
jgi:hypothetical protein